MTEELRMDSRILAKSLGISHKELMKLIEENREVLESMGELPMFYDTPSGTYREEKESVVNNIRIPSIDTIKRALND